MVPKTHSASQDWSETMVSTTVKRGSVMLIALGHLTIGAVGTTACGGGDVAIGETAQALSNGTCPVAKCQENVAVGQPVGADGGAAAASSAISCTYYDGVSAAGGEWWSDHTELGWDLLVPGATPRAGTVTNLTCSPSQFAGQGSKAGDACAWKYRCVPAPDAVGDPAGPVDASRGD
jgi:hypothetical protein